MNFLKGFLGTPDDKSRFEQKLLEYFEQFGKQQQWQCPL